MANPLSQVKNDHHIIFGIALILVGGFGVIGSLTGRLAPMIAGLFDPSDLVSASGGSGNLLSAETGPGNVVAVGGGGIANAVQGTGIPTGISDLVTGLFG